MQIRLTVLGPRSSGPVTDAHTCDVLVTAPDGTALGAVAAALAGAAGLRSGARGGRGATHVHLYAGSQRLDEHAVLGQPPLVEGAILHIDGPGPGEEDGPAEPASPTQLHVVGGPDAGGVHLLHAGVVTVGRSADADVPLDDPDVSRLHLVLSVAPGGRATVVDRGSTNGTTLDGDPVGAEPRPVPAGALLRLGESTLQVVPSSAAALGRGTSAIPDGQGHLQVAAGTTAAAQAAAQAAYGTARATAHAAGLSPGLSAVPPAGRPSPASPWLVPRARGASPSEDLTAEQHAPTPLTPRAAARARRLLSRGREALSSRSTFNGRENGRENGHETGHENGRGSPSGSAALDGGAPDRDALHDPAPGGSGRPSATQLAAAQRLRWPDPAALLLTALGKGPQLWERDAGHPDAFTVRLGTTDAPLAGAAPLSGAPVTVDLRGAGSLGLVGPRPRLAGLARSVAAQLAVLHGPSTLELVLVCADPERDPAERTEEWSWLYWLPQLRPTRDQQCRLLTGLDPAQAQARIGELTARLDAGRGGRSPVTVLLVDGDPGSPQAREGLRRLVTAGPALGIHPVCLAEQPGGLPPGCGALATIGGEVATLLRLETPACGNPAVDGVVLDAVSAEWAQRLGRALAPLRELQATQRGRGPLPQAPRLLDLLDLELVTPAKLSARWSQLPPSAEAVTAVIGAARDGLCTVDLADASGAPGGGPHLLAGGGPGSGKTELLRTLIASLAVAERPDRLKVILVQGRPVADDARGLRACTDLPHVSAFLDAADIVPTLRAAEALSTELTRREQLFRGRSWASWHAEHAWKSWGGRERAPGLRPGGMVAPRTAPDHLGAGGPEPGRVAVEAAPAGALPAPPPRVLVVVDDYDALLDPVDALAAPGARGALTRALDSVALRGARVGMHLMATTGHPERTSGSALDEAAQLRIALRTDDPGSSQLLIHVDDAAGLSEEHPGRGYLRHPDGGVTAFQAAKVSGRIPRTATLRPTVVALEWAEMGAAPTRRPVRELGNGPTDLALLGSALQRAAESLETAPATPLA